MIKAIRTCVLTFTLSFMSFSQTAGKSELVFGPSKLTTKQTGIVYHGKNCGASAPDSKVFTDTAEVVRIGTEIYYQSHLFSGHIGRGDGLVVEDTAKRTCRVYPMFALAEAGGWYNRMNPADSTPDATQGLHRSGDKLWIGSNGIGVMVFDQKLRTWTRYDVKDQAMPGDHIGVDFADENFVFVTHGEFPNAALHIYSVKQNKWLALKSVATRLVRDYGTNSKDFDTDKVQVIVNHRQYADKAFFPVDWTMMYPDVSWSESDGAYIVEKDLGRGKTVFQLPRAELERAFK